MKTLTIYASTDCAFVTGSSTDYSTARGTATGHHSHIDPDSYFTDSGIYKVMRSFLKFDTSVLPDAAAIINAQLRMTSYDYEIDRGFSVEIVKQDWSAYDPITAVNRDDAYDGSLAGTLDVNLNTFSVAIGKNTTFHSSYLDTTQISTTDTTWYSLRSSRDNDDDAPTGSEYALFHSAEITSIAYKPALIVNYYEPSTDTPSDTLGYILPMDWDGTQLTTSWQDEAPRLLRFAIDRGRDRTIGSPGGGFESPQPGSMIIELDNWDGRYDPWNASGPLYGKIGPGVRVNFAYFNEGIFYNVFTGFIEDIRMSGYKTSVTMTVKDGAGWLRDKSPEVPLLTGQTVDQAIGEILTKLGYPFGRDLDTGVNALPYYWSSGSNGLNEVTDLAVSDFGRFCVNADGTARFRSRNNSDAVDHTIEENKIGKNIYFPMPWDYSRYIVDVYAYPRITGPIDSTLWTLRGSVDIPAGETITLRGTYTYDNQRVPATGVYIDSVAPTTDISLFNLTLTAYSREAEIDIANPSASSKTLTSVILKGTPIYSPDEVIVSEEADTQPTPASFVFDYPWLGSVNTAGDYAKILLAYLSDNKKYPEITIFNRPDLSGNIDLEHRLRLKLDTLGIDQTFFVNKVSHRSGRSLQEIITTVKLNPTLQDQSDDVFILDSLTNGVLDTNELGF